MKKVKYSSVKNVNNILVSLQLIFTLLTFILFIVFLITKEYWGFLELLLGIDLLIMAYNNQVIYKRRKLTIIFVVISVVLIIFSFIHLIGR